MFLIHLLQRATSIFLLLTAKDKKSHKNHRSRRRTFNLSILQSFPIINCVYVCIWLACVYFMVYKNLKVGILSRFQGSLLETLLR